MAVAFFIVLSLLHALSAESATTDPPLPSETLSAIHKPCCHQRIGKGDVFSIDKDMKEYRMTYYKDFKNKRQLELHTGGQTDLRYLYRNFTTMRKYQRFLDGRCVESSMIGENIHCVPSDAKIQTSIRLDDGYGSFRQLIGWDFQSHGERDFRVVDNTGGRCHPYLFQHQGLTHAFHNVADHLDEEDFHLFDVGLSDCTQANQG